MKPDIWINGEFVGWNDARIHPFCHSLQRASTIFESIDCKEAFNGRPVIFRLRDHMVRLENSASIIGMPSPFDTDTLIRAAVNTVAKSGLTTCTIRPLMLYSDVVMEVFPHNSAVSVMIGLGEGTTHSSPLTVKISSIHKIDCDSMPVKAKVAANYIGPMMAKSEAIAAGFDEALIVDDKGNIAEGSTSNFFIVENGILITAPESTILAGITRQSIFEIAKKRGYEIREEIIPPERLKNADEAIICSSGKGVAPVIKVDETVIGNGRPGELTLDLAEYYSSVTSGAVPEFEHWLTYV